MRDEMRVITHYNVTTHAWKPRLTRVRRLVINYKRH